MLDLDALDAWLTAGGVTAPFAHNYLAERTDEVIALDDTGGLAMTLQRLFDRPTVQVRTRSPSQQRSKALAAQVDSLIVDAELPFALGTKRVIDAGRVGGAPYYMGADDRNRDMYTANYWFEVAR